MTTFTLDANLEQQINFIAQEEQTTVSTWIADTLAHVIEDYQDLRAIKQYEQDKANGTLEILSIAELKEFLNVAR